MKNENLEKAIQLFDNELASIDGKTVTLTASRQWTKGGNVATKIQSDFAIRFLRNSVNAINVLTGKRVKGQPLAASALTVRALLETIKDQKNLTFLFDSFKGAKQADVQSKLDRFKRGLNKELGITDVKFNFSNIDVLNILKAASKCYLKTTFEKPKVVKVKKAAKKAGLNWFSFLKSKGKKATEVKTGTAIHGKLMKEYRAATNPRNVAPTV